MANLNVSSSSKNIKNTAYWFIYFGYSENYNKRGAFAIIFLICRYHLNCPRSVGTIAITTGSGENSLKVISTKPFLTKVTIFVLIYSLYGQPKCFKFKQKYQKYGSRFQIIFPFLMTMIKCRRMDKLCEYLPNMNFGFNFFLSLLMSGYKCPLKFIFPTVLKTTD